MRKSQIKIGIVGAGSVGNFFSVMLASHGFDVELVRRQKGIMIDNSCIIDIKGDFGNKSYLIPIVNTYEDFTSKKDFIIVCTKTFDAIDLLKPLQKHLTKNGAIVTIQNIFFIDKLLTIIAPEKSICMHIDFNCETIDQVVRVLDYGGVTLGVYNKGAFEKMKVFENILNQFLDVDIVTDVFGFVMGRNIINGAISLLGAISGLRLGNLLNDRNGRYLFVKLIEESVRVCNKYRIKIQPYNCQLDYYKFLERSFSGMLYRFKIIKALKKNNKNIKSSALDDLEMNRQTELDFLIESLISSGERFKIDIRYLKTLNEIFKEIKQGKLRISDNVFYDKRLINIKEK